MRQQRHNRRRISGRYQNSRLLDGRPVSVSRTDRIVTEEGIPLIDTILTENTPTLDCGHEPNGQSFRLADGRLICSTCAMLCPECGGILLEEQYLEYNGVFLHYTCWRAVQREEERGERETARRKRNAAVINYLAPRILKKLGWLG